MMIDGFSHVMLYVRDIERAVKWYSDVLGFSQSYVAPGSYASLRHERFGARLDLHATADSANVGHGARAYFVADDLERTLAELKRVGVKVSDARRIDGSPRIALAWDSEGNELGLEERRNVPGE